MFAVLLATAVVMGFIAITFVAAPLARNRRRFGIIGAALFIPLFTSGMYLVVGSPEAAETRPPTHPVTQASPGAKTQKKSIDSVASMVDGLAARLRANPEDGKSWLLLARSYMHLQRMQEALDAYQRAASLGQYDKKLAELAESPEQPDSTSAQIVGRVELAREHAEIVLPTDTVFIFARAVAGPPMPIAVLQRPASDLPLDFRLNDSQAMSTDIKLSNFDRVVVTARISRSGVATDALRGLEAMSEEVVVAEHQHLHLVIQ